MVRTIGSRISWSKVRRVLRKTLSVASILLSIAATTLWARSFGTVGEQDYFSFLREDGRYTIRSIAGRVFFFAPPSRLHVNAENGEASVEEKIADLRNEDMRCTVAGSPVRMLVIEHVGTGPSHVLGVGYPYFRELPIPVRRPYASSEMAPALLKSLEQPDKFVAAHVLLGGLFPSTPPVYQGQLKGGDARVDVDGLPLRFTWIEPLGTNRSDENPACTWEVDLADLPAVRNRWHLRLDVQAASVPYWVLTTCMACVPLLQFAMLIRGRLARRCRSLGRLCTQCGYDLRATPDRCPECGVVPAAAPSPPT